MIRLLLLALVGVPACGPVDFAALDGDREERAPPATAFVVDPTFGSSGIVLLGQIAPANDLDRGVAVASDGRLFVVGASTSGGSSQSLIMRLADSGAVDPTFGDAGVALAGAANDHVTALAAASDGGLVAAGASGTAPLALRMTGDGGPDVDFGSAGVARPALSGSASSLVLQGSARVLLGGATQSGTSTVAQTLRLDSRGELEAARGEIIDDPTSGDEYGIVAVDGASRIYTYGNEYAPARRCFIVRRSADGVLDPSFASAGVFLADVGVDCVALAFARDGAILTLGISASGDAFVVMRLDAEGVPDTSFGMSGVVTAFVGGSASAAGVIELDDGRIVALGSARQPSGTQQIVVLALLSDGAVDGTIGSGGQRVFDPRPGSDARAYTALRDRSGRLVVYGVSAQPTPATFVLRLR